MSVHCFCVYHLSFVILTDHLLIFMYFLAAILPIWHQTLINQSINQSISSQKLQGLSKLLLKGNIFCEIPICFVFCSWHQANKLCACFYNQMRHYLYSWIPKILCTLTGVSTMHSLKNIFFIPCYQAEKLYLNNHHTKCIK